jgi:hypothetical protein
MAEAIVRVNVWVIVRVIVEIVCGTACLPRVDSWKDGCWLYRFCVMHPHSPQGGFEEENLAISELYARNGG